MVWLQATFAILVLLGALAVHHKVQPFRFEFQNRLETGLFVSDVRVHGPSAGLAGPWPATPQPPMAKVLCSGCSEALGRAPPTPSLVRDRPHEEGFVPFHNRFALSRFASSIR